MAMQVKIVTCNMCGTDLVAQIDKTLECLNAWFNAKFGLCLSAGSVIIRAPTHPDPAAIIHRPFWIPKAAMEYRCYPNEKYEKFKILNVTTVPPCLEYGYSYTSIWAYEVTKPRAICPCSNKMGLAKKV
ncbi:hypothetical protein PCH_Pc22g06150 [Penicillium rubens Wisconsin 54-1255]|uniref:Uncharacterized protein n=1 Tax=Penicillium rubens (strain ATCC 28089 / DSM 1075 / NRRL 1951 / Wisconsin 54-1255) TaxID=500485 RepID=B6HVK2_PENRW|nr:hypothetical protein PCH_Pc22g06150 [Penicillium rubens Wisconsin 54-1255]